MPAWPPVLGPAAADDQQLTPLSQAEGICSSLEAEPDCKRFLLCNCLQPLAMFRGVLNTGGVFAVFCQLKSLSDSDNNDSHSRQGSMGTRPLLTAHLCTPGLAGHVSHLLSG